MNIRHSLNRIHRCGLSLLLSLLLPLSAAAENGEILIEERGTGPTLVFIPGLNSDSATFTETCEAFVTTHRCLLLSLPGFAGTPPMNLDHGFMPALRDRIIALLQERNEDDVTLIGHSLGGVLSMMITLQAPALVQQLVLIDSVPFYSAIQFPALTVDMVRPQAEQMRRLMQEQDPEQYRRGAEQSIRGMSNRGERQALLRRWARDSDQATTAQAMYEMMTTDLRSDIAAIRQPVLVLGSWAAYEATGSTRESTRAVFEAQYAALQQAQILLSDSGYHFLSWDDADWVNARIREFIGD